jgi:hypothetical protein
VSIDSSHVREEKIKKMAIDDGIPIKKCACPNLNAHGTLPSYYVLI